MILDIDGTIISPTLESLIGEESCMQEHLYRHFSSPGHGGFLNDVSVILIDKTDGSDPKKREDYWMKTLKTMAPYGLNIEDSV